MEENDSLKYLKIYEDMLKIDDTISCWEQFMTPRVELFNDSTQVTHICPASMIMFKYGYRNDSKRDFKDLINLAKVILPVCLACDKKRLASHSEDNSKKEE